MAMMELLGYFRSLFWACAALAAVLLPAAAQENLDAGKSPAQIFASDCAICHKSPQGLAKGGGLLGVSRFLREHYTASRETAAVLGAYLQQLEATAPAAKPRQPRRATSGGTPKPSEKPKAADGKSDSAKAGETKPGNAGPSEVKPVEAKPVEPKSAESKDTNSPAGPTATPPASESKPDSAATAKPASESNAAADKPAAASSGSKE